jgi:hypothetical protein
MESKKLKKETSIDDDLRLRIYATEISIIAELCYKNGKRMIVKMYPNTRAGEVDCEKFTSGFRSSEDILNYFNKGKR